MNSSYLIQFWLYIRIKDQRFYKKFAYHRPQISFSLGVRFLILLVPLTPVKVEIHTRHNFEIYFLQNPKKHIAIEFDWSFILVSFGGHCVRSCKNRSLCIHAWNTSKGWQQCLSKKGKPNLYSRKIHFRYACIYVFVNFLLIHIHQRQMFLHTYNFLIWINWQIWKEIYCTADYKFLQDDEQRIPKRLL